MIESELYDPIKRWIEGPEFAPVHDQGFCNQVRLGAVTASLQWLEGVGSWMRPDLALTVIARRKYDATPALTVSAFEVKADVPSLTEPFFQALSYSRFADYCYLVAPIEAGWTPEVRQLAERFGVGLVEFGDAAMWHTYRVTLGMPMHPDPKLRETFIDAAFGSDSEQLLIRRNLLGQRTP